MGRVTFAVDIDGTITENGGGTIHLDALAGLRHMVSLGHRVIFVSGRSSVEGYVLSVFGGTTGIAVGENGGCITTAPTEHMLLGEKQKCVEALGVLRSRYEDVREKPVFERLTEVVLERTFDIGPARRHMADQGLDVQLSDSGYAFHINSRGIDKGAGFGRVMDMLDIAKKDVVAIGDSETDVPLFRIAGTSVALGNSSDEVRSQASMSVDARSGDGVLDALDRLAPGLGA